jgi:hypothetical protein
VDELLQPWERQPSEPPRAYHAFAHYRDLGPCRSSDKAWRKHREDCEGVQTLGNQRAKNWQVWSIRWGWVHRAGLWDAEVDKQGRAKAAKELVEARQRHARLAQGALTVLTAPVRATLDALQDPTIMQRLATRARADPEAFLSMVVIVARVASTISSLVNIEREALGVDGDTPDPTDNAGNDVSFAARITADPGATDMAIALLDRVAGTGGLRSH